MTASISLMTKPSRTVDDYIALINEQMSDETVSDILINRYDRIFVERAGTMEEAPFHLDSTEGVRQLADIIIALCGKTELAKKTPLIEGMLPDGNRVTVILPPVGVEGPSIAIRKFPKNPITLDQMVANGVMTPQVAVFLKAASLARTNIIISGSTSSGKTTMLNALSAHIGPTERVVTIEDTPELRIQQKNVVRMESRDAEVPGGLTITPRDLVKSSLRIRPDRIVMGEIRGAEAFDLLQAINTGHDGTMATIHANNPREAFTRLEQMVSMANSNTPSKYIRQQIASAVDLVIQTTRDDKGRRRISHITEIVGMEMDVVTTQDIFVLEKKEDKYNYVMSSMSSRNPRIAKALLEAKAAR